jgi:hypothetical protein
MVMRFASSSRLMRRTASDPDDRDIEPSSICATHACDEHAMVARISAQGRIGPFWSAKPGLKRSPRSIARTALWPMAMGKRKRHAKQGSMSVASQDLPRSAAHPFYTRLNQILDEHDFDGYVEGLCEEGRPGLPPGRSNRAFPTSFAAQSTPTLAPLPPSPLGLDELGPECGTARGEHLDVSRRRLVV